MLFPETARHHPRAPDTCLRGGDSLHPQSSHPTLTPSGKDLVILHIALSVLADPAVQGEITEPR